MGWCCWEGTRTLRVKYSSRIQHYKQASRFCSPWYRGMDAIKVALTVTLLRTVEVDISQCSRHNHKIIIFWPKVHSYLDCSHRTKTQPHPQAMRPQKHPLKGRLTTSHRSPQPKPQLKLFQSGISHHESKPRLKKKKFVPSSIIHQTRLHGDHLPAPSSNGE